MVPDFSLLDYNSIQGISRATSDIFYQMKKKKGKKISKQAFFDATCICGYFSDESLCPSLAEPELTLAMPYFL